MRVAAFRSGIPALFSSSSPSLLIPSPFIRPPPHTSFPTPHPSSPPHPFLRSSPFHRRLSSTPMATPAAPSDSAAIAASNKNGSGASVEKQFEGFRAQLEDSGAVRDRIRAVVAEMESAVRLMQSSVLLVHQSLPIQQVLEKARVQIEALKELFKKLADILRECPGQYYRYHGDWRSETQNAVSLIAFLHWLETGSLLMHPEAEEKLGLNSSEFSLDIEDYLVGLCFMSNDFPRYVVNRVTAGDYDCPRKVLTFLTDLHASFRMLNLRNDFLRKKFDSMKYDLRRVEEVFYDVKIRSLAPADSIQDQSTQG